MRPNFEWRQFARANNLHRDTRFQAQEYLDRFVHVYESVINANQYGVTAIHYSNSTFDDGAILNRWSEEKLWFQKVSARALAAKKHRVVDFRFKNIHKERRSYATRKKRALKVNFTHNTEAVLWSHNPQHAIVENTPLAEITYHIDNCSIHDNYGPIIDTHRDAYSSANIFHWKFWSNTFANNSRGGIAVHLPDTYDLLASKEHTFWVSASMSREFSRLQATCRRFGDLQLTENRFEQNWDFYVRLSGYYAFANMSSNNYTDNYAIEGDGIVSLDGMEKQLIMERNRMSNNWVSSERQLMRRVAQFAHFQGNWMIRVRTDSHSVRSGGFDVRSYIQFNYIQNNWFIEAGGDYVDNRPRSFAIGAFGVQLVDIHYNRLKNALMDFEVVAGCKASLFSTTCTTTMMQNTLIAENIRSRHDEHHIQLVRRRDRGRRCAASVRRRRLEYLHNRQLYALLFDRRIFLELLVASAKGKRPLA